MKYSANSVWENKDEYDVAVIGAGHAGCEAALASARLGLKTIVFTVSVDSIALMPCNPNIGGSSKGHLVKEIDALGGEKTVCSGCDNCNGSSIHYANDEKIALKFIKRFNKNFSVDELETELQSLFNKINFENNNISVFFVLIEKVIYFG